MGVRDYDAKLSQFLTPDPLFLENLDKCAESPLECNLYGYAKGNPLSWTDPSGMEGRSAAVMYSECRDCGPIAKAVGIEGRYTSIGLSDGKFQIGYLGSDGKQHLLQVPMSALRGDSSGGYRHLPGNVLAPRLWNESSAPEISSGMEIIASIYDKQADGAIAAMKGFELVLNYAGALQTAAGLFRGLTLELAAAPSAVEDASSGTSNLARTARPLVRNTVGAAERTIPKFTRAMKSQAKVIARGDRIDKVDTLVEKFGGQARKWSKMKTWTADGAEIHWYEHPGIGKVGIKWDGFPDPF
jgi:hypothetical protein